MMEILEWIQSWDVVMTGQAPAGIDMMLTMMFTAAALTGYTAISVSGPGSVKWRWIATLGWTLWSVRFWWAEFVGDDPTVPIISALSAIMISVGALFQNLCDTFPDCHRKKPGDATA